MKRIVFGLALLAASGLAQAGIYKCKDAQGAVKIQDKPCGGDAAMPVPKLLPPPDAPKEHAETGKEGAPVEGNPAGPEILYRVDPATGKLIPAAILEPTEPKEKPKPKGNWDRYADQLEQENQAATERKQRASEGNQAAAEEIRRKKREYEERQKEEAEEYEEQRKRTEAENERFTKEKR